MTTKDVKPSMAKQKQMMRKAIRLVGSQVRLAEAVGCSQMMVWKLVHGRARISVEMARKIRAGSRLSHAESRATASPCGRSG